MLNLVVNEWNKVFFRNRACLKSDYYLGFQYNKRKTGVITMNIEPHELTDEQWNQIKNLFPKYRTGRPPKSNRTMFNAVLWIARSGAAWRDLPKERYGSWKTVYSRFCLQRDTGLLESLFITLNSKANDENLSIDSTSVTAHQHSAGAKKGGQIPLKPNISAEVAADTQQKSMLLSMGQETHCTFNSLVETFMIAYQHSKLGMCQDRRQQHHW